MFGSLQLAARHLRSRVLIHLGHHRPELALAGMPQGMLQPADHAWNEAIWFAVPKQKITRHKKRLKTTVQKRIKLKKNIIVDPRTGEVSLMHKLPFNWKDYLPKDS